MKKWQKKLKNFLFSGKDCGKSSFSVPPEAVALLLLREMVNTQGTLAVTLPDAKAAEKVFSALEELMNSLDLRKRILAVPECGRGKLLFPGGEARRARALNRVLNEKFDLIFGSVHAMLGPAPLPEAADPNPQ